MSTIVFDIVAPALTDIAKAEDGDKMDLDHGDDERTEKEM